ncbi:MAG TPA: sugar ABC transporter substrate-binding protein [Solirubrobacterales bacterium]|nr:sugar ABC transporter substrate-binding protein [Solirubrobacterales bacterium]
MAAFAVLGALIAAVLAAGCGGGGGASSSTGESEGGTEPLRLGVSFDLYNSARTAEKKGIEDAVAEAGGEIVSFQVADEDPAKQASQIETMIQSNGANAILVIPSDSAQIASSIGFAKSQGVPVVVEDRGVEDTSQIAFQVTGEPETDGMAVGEYLAGLDQPQKVIELVGALTDENAVGRKNGFNKAIEGSGNVELLQEVPTNWDREEALNGLTAALRSHPDVTAVFTPSDYLDPSVESALKSASRWAPIGSPKHVNLLQIDGDQNGCRLLKTKYSNYDNVTPLEEFGAKAVHAAVEVLEGKEPPQKTETLPGFSATAENFKEKESEIWGCTAPPEEEEG